MVCSKNFDLLERCDSSNSTAKIIGQLDIAIDNVYGNKISTSWTLTSIVQKQSITWAGQKPNLQDILSVKIVKPFVVNYSLAENCIVP